MSYCMVKKSQTLDFIMEPVGLNESPQVRD